MNAIGMIVEINPFHNGHKVHIDETRKITGKGIVAVMSGNFVQRGEPALIDKWRRTKTALLNGVDIVLELPVPYVISGADYFARGSVNLLASTGIVDTLSFGSECGNIQAIKDASQILAEEPQIYKDSLKNTIKKGLSFAAAKGIALESTLKNIPEGLLTKPNNGLAMEYCKALALIGNPMEIITTHRQQGGTSATKIRKAFHNGELLIDQMPKNCQEILTDAHKKNETAHLNDFTQIIKYLLQSEQTTNINLGEGLENRFRQKAGNYAVLTELISAVKTKRYTRTRIQRAAMQILLKITAQDMNEYENNGGIQYIRVLGFRKDATNVLSQLTKKSTLPVITHGKAIDQIISQGGIPSKMLAKELEAGDIYRIATKQKGGYQNERSHPIIKI